MESKGIIMFNRGSAIVVRAIVSLYSIRKHYDGDITFFVEDEYPHEFDDVLRYFNCNIVHLDKKHEFKTLVRKNSLFELSPYKKTLWLDADIVVNGKLDKMFNYLDEKNVDFCIPSFCNWKSTGKHIAKRIKRFDGIAEDRFIQEALKEHDAINTGIFSFRKSDKWIEFVKYWTDLADKGAKAGIFIPDETAGQVLYPSMGEWGLKYFIAPTDYNVSPIHDHGLSKNPIIYHFHGDKNVLDGVVTCQIWKDIFKEMCDNNIANINAFLKYADKRLAKYLNGEVVWGNGKTKSVVSKNQEVQDVTIVTAVDEKYVEILRETYPNWVKYKRVDKHPVIVFVNGMDINSDQRLDFLRQPNITMIPWNEDSMDKVDSHRELMLSCFVLGTAKHVKTDYWIKLDADTYATDDRPLYDEDFKNYAFVSHKWGYSRPEFIKKLDEWAKGHWKGKLKNATPMMNDGRVDGNRFYHNGKRNISFVQFHKTKFIKFCVKLLRENRLPVPSHDTYTYFICQKFDPQLMMLKNFKKNYGFSQGNGKSSIEDFKKKLQEIDRLNDGKINVIPEVINDAEMDSDYFNGDNDKDFINVLPEISVSFVQKKIDVTPIKLVDEFPPICRCPEGDGNTVEIRMKP